MAWTRRAGRLVDVMIGSRYIPGGGVEGWPLKRQLMSRAVNLYARWLLGLRPKDCSGAFRCYRTEMLARLDFDAIRSRGYSFQEEILWRLKRLGARFGETPIVFVERQHGVSKIDSGEGAGRAEDHLCTGDAERAAALSEGNVRTCRSRWAVNRAHPSIMFRDSEPLSRALRCNGFGCRFGTSAASPSRMIFRTCPPGTTQ